MAVNFVGQIQAQFTQSLGSRDIRYGSIRQEVQMLHNMQANELTDSVDAG